MSFTLSQQAREIIANEYLMKNDLAFGCSTKHNIKMRDNKSGINVLFEDGLSDAQVLESILYHDISNLIQNSFWKAHDKIELLFSLATQKQNFFKEEFRVLAKPKVNHLIKFNPKTNRIELMQELFSKLGINLRASRALPIQQTVDELVMNAQVNAPKNSRVKYGRDSILFVEMDDKLIAITVIDYYGTMDIKKFLKKIEGCLKLGRGDAINYGQGGAGLGGSIVYNHCDTILLGCLGLRKTRVTSILPYNIAEKQYSTIQKSICIFS